MRKRKIKLTEFEYAMFIQVSKKLFKLAKTMDDNELYIHHKYDEEHWFISLDDIQDAAQTLETLATDEDLVLIKEELIKEEG